MRELIIESTPLGAEVKIAGEAIGTTPITVPIDDASLEAFRVECMANGAVSCTWDVLRVRLEDHSVSMIWWSLTENERRSIADVAIKNTINKVVWYYKQGIDGSWKKLESPCAYNATIRYQKFGTPIGWGDCYWKYDLASSEVFKYAPSEYYALPMVNINIASHVMCGLQVVNSISKLDNWVIFQYLDYNIKPGNKHLPYGSHVRVQNPFPYTSESCISFDSTLVTEFYT